MWTTTHFERYGKWRHPHYGMGMIYLIIKKHFMIVEEILKKLCTYCIVGQVRPAYERGIIENVVDERLENKYNLSSIWKVAEVAMTCVQFEGAKIPTMNVVCIDLSEAIGMESNHESSSWITTEVSSVYSLLQVR